jgi:hypothetical protein
MVDWFIKNCKCNPLSISAFLKRPAYFYRIARGCRMGFLKKFVHTLAAFPVTQADCFL